GCATPDDEKPTLDHWAAKQISHPELEFGNYLYNEDPTTQSECIGSDPVASGELGLRNIDREVAYLIPASTKPGDNYDDLRDLYNTLLGQRFTELDRVLRYIGGVVETNYHAGHGGVVFHPVPKTEQAEAVHFLVSQGLHTPKDFLNPNLVGRIYPDGNVARVVGRENGIITSLLADDRVNRMLDDEAMNGAKAYTIANLASDLQNGVFDELDEAHPTISVYRRALQLQYLTTVDSRINGTSATKTELNGIERSELHKLAERIDKSMRHSADEATSRHLANCRRMIELIEEDKLTPAVPPAAPATATPAFPFPRPGGEDLWPGVNWDGPSGS
ncbi:MAG TPA: zinc-dependent metalloprotease, partial [Fimbriimonadaceae bacterium]|nr:zinc-dependent metalloprotease [Fimbriimonadaceae bacterium]